MRGRILGFADASGVISGEDGKRYKFVTGDWKLPRVPRAGEEVDYEISPQGMAAEIYPLRSGIDLADMGAKVKDAFGNGGVDLADVGVKAKRMLADGPVATRALATVKTRLGAALAVVVLIVSVVFNYVSWLGDPLPLGGAAKPAGHSILGLSSFVDSVGDVMSEIRKQAKSEAAVYQQQYDEMVKAGYSDTAAIKTELDKANAFAGKTSLAGLLLDLMYVLYLVPLGAAFILFREWQGRPLPLVNLAVGAGGVLALVLAYLAKAEVNGAIRGSLGNLAGPLADDMPFGMHVSFGAWLLLGFGALLVLESLGIVRLSSRGR